ncbi:MAG: tetratricopeptide repeat protein, partial [Gaiellaceae bacterium]
ERLLDVLDEALEARVLVHSPRTRRRLQFSHALVRDTLYDELGDGKRARLHRAAGEALERLYAGDPGAHLTELAHHFAEAATRGDAAKAVDYARRAGDRAAGMLAFEEAVRLYRLALESLDAGDPATRCELLLAMGDAKMRAGDESGAKASLREVAAIAREQDAPEQLARAALGYGGRFLWGRAGADPQLVPLLEDALAHLDERHPELRAKVLGRLATALRDQPRRDRRAALAEEAVAVARDLGDDATLAYALEARFEATEAADNIREHVAQLPEMFALARASGDVERLIVCHEVSLHTTLQLGDAASALPHYDEMTRLAEELHQPAHDWLMTAWRAVLDVMRGAFASAEELIEQGRELGRQAQSWNAEVSYRVSTYVLRKQQGQLAEIEELLEQSVAEYGVLPRFQCMLASAYAELGRREAAARACDALLAEDLESWHVDTEWLFAMTELAEAVVLLDDEHRAARLYPVLLPYARLNAVAPVEAVTGSTARVLGMLAAALGRFDEAERHFEHALEANERLGARPWVAHTKHQHARMLLRRAAAGDAERAHALLEGARRDYEELGMKSWAERARDTVPPALA